jgi:hypothetical protein
VLGHGLLRLRGDGLPPSTSDDAGDAAEVNSSVARRAVTTFLRCDVAASPQVNEVVADHAT